MGVGVVFDWCHAFFVCLNARRIWASTPQIADYADYADYAETAIVIWTFDPENEVKNIQ